jgi:hypothetical protein
VRGGVLVTPLAALACEQVRAGTRLFSLASVNPQVSSAHCFTRRWSWRTGGHLAAGRTITLQKDDPSEQNYIKHVEILRSGASTALWDWVTLH